MYYILMSGVLGFFREIEPTLYVKWDVESHDYGIWEVLLS